MDKTAKKPLAQDPAAKKSKKSEKPSHQVKAEKPNMTPPATPISAPVARIPQPVSAPVPVSPKKGPLEEATEVREKLHLEWIKGDNGRDMNLIGQYLEGAMIHLIKLKYLECSGCDIPAGEEILARDILEIGIMYSIFKENPDMQMFCSYMSQLKAYYYDYGQSIPMSTHKYEILGAYLLYLLSDNRLGEFHVEVERILHPIESSQQIMQNVYIRRAIELERALEEGRFSQVHSVDGLQMESKLWCYFIGILMTNTRLQVAETIEAAYEKLNFTAAMERLKFTVPGDMEDFARKRNWNLIDGYYHFKQEASEDDFIPADKLLNDFVGYAKEMESII